MMDNLGQEIAFRALDVAEGYVPAMTLGSHQQAKLNFGQVWNVINVTTERCYHMYTSKLIPHSI